ncbi:MAG TPA: NAD(P)-binding domain-containing protein [Pseudonocardiaceae bacterium]
MPSTTIGIFGAGRVGSTLATGFAATGHDVIVGTRDGARPADWKGPDGVRFADHADTASGAAVVFNATPGNSAVERLSALRSELSGKVLVDLSNALKPGHDGEPQTLIYPNSSVAELLQQALPDTQVVKALNTMTFMVMMNPKATSTPPAVYLSGNDDGAKKTVAGLLGAVGWQEDWIVDLGDVRTARGPESFMLFVPSLFGLHGFVPLAMTVAY